MITRARPLLHTEDLIKQLFIKAIAPVLLIQSIPAIMESVFDMLEGFETPSMKAVCVPQACADLSCSLNNRRAHIATQDQGFVLHCDKSAAPIDLALALESACWDLEFLVCMFVQSLHFMILHTYNLTNYSV
jgi:hypothetical protein